MGYEIPNPGVWSRKDTLRGEWTSDGGDDFGALTVPTKVQQLTFAGELAVYQLTPGAVSLDHDYYLVAGHVYHGITGSPEDPSANWVSVGFYANHQSLTVRCDTPDARVAEFGPNSTVEDVSINFFIGASLEGGSESGQAKGGAGLNAGVGFSFSAPAVRFAARPSLTSVQWRVDLPGVGYLGAANPPNPLRSSYAGYDWNPAAMFKVPSGVRFDASAQLSVYFAYDWTRGIEARTFDETIPLESQTVVTGTAAARAPRTILETLRSLSSPGPGEPGRVDTFLAGLEADRFAACFGTTTGTVAIVLVPTNQAIKDYIDRNPDPRQFAGPRGMRWLSDWLIDNISNYVPGSENARLEALRNHPAMFELIECRDGWIVLFDHFDVQDDLRAILAQG